MATTAATIPLAFPLKEVPVGRVLLVRTLARKRPRKLLVVEASAVEVLVQSSKTVELSTGSTIWTKEGRVWNAVGQLQKRQCTIPVKEGACGVKRD